MIRTASAARIAPPAPPTKPRRTLSLRRCLTIRPPLAPRAARMAISLRRASPRDSSRFATFAQAISSTNPTAPVRISSGSRIRPATWSRSGTMLNVRPPVGG